MIKKVIITGGSQGIGKVIAKKLLIDNYQVHILARNEKDLQKCKDELSSLGDLNYTILDLAKREQVSEFCKSWKGSLYALINNAGICQTEKLTEEKGGWDEIMRTNLEGVYFLTKGLIKKIENNGRIINISSQLGKEGRAGYGAYCASKFGVIGLTKCWAKELGHVGITVNAICPGWVETEMSKKDLTRIAQEKGVDPAKFYQEICQPLELKRFTKPEEVANLVSFLASKEANGITGRDWLLNTIWNQE